MKKIIPIILISLVFIYLIFVTNKSNQINILSIGDIYSDGYNNNYYPSYNDYFKESLNKYDSYNILVFHDLKSILFSINNNDYFNDKQLKNIVKNSNIIILNIGIEQIKNNEAILNNDYLTKYLNDYESLLIELSKLNNYIYVINIPKNIISSKYQLIINDYYEGLINKYHLNLIDVKEYNIESINPVIYQYLNSLELTN